jgi:uncharacterized damage-inducible protein DinB
MIYFLPMGAYIDGMQTGIFREGNWRYTMFREISDFESAWKNESQSTLKIFKALTQDSLSRAVDEGHRTLGRMAWHIVLSIPEMMGRTGLKIEGISENDPVPEKLQDIISRYEKVSSAVLAEVKEKWSDDDLLKEDDMYAEMWKRGFTLFVLITHEIHHRGQMTVLMRQAGLKVPGVFGPSKEEWASFGATPPAI